MTGAAVIRDRAAIITCAYLLPTLNAMSRCVAASLQGNVYALVSFVLSVLLLLVIQDSEGKGEKAEIR